MKFAFMISFCLAAACATTASAMACQSAVNAEIARFGVTPDQISKTVVSRNVEAGDDGRIIGHTYWMQLKSCSPGYLIVDTNRTCYIQQVYTTGECQVTGVTHY